MVNDRKLGAGEAPGQLPQSTLWYKSTAAAAQPLKSAKTCWLAASRYVDRAAAFSTWAHRAWRVNDAVGHSGSPDLEGDGGSAEDRRSSSSAANCRAASAASALAARAARTFRRTKCFPDRSFFLGFPCRQTSLVDVVECSACQIRHRVRALAFRVRMNDTPTIL